MDGVIVDSEPLHKESFLQVWQNLGYGNNHGINFADFYGTSDRTVWKAFIDKHQPKIHIDELMLLRKQRLIELLRDKKPIFDGFVALGCVIKGETPHFDLISKAVVKAIMDLSIESKKPIGNGIITCLNKKQALERADPKGKNIGGHAVSAVLQTLANFK